MAESQAFTLSLEVRDYECDLQGIVNNAVYQHYLEHARHMMLKRAGVHFDTLNQAGTFLVVVRAELDYKAPLRSGDAFVITSRVEQLSPVRCAFVQEITRPAKAAPTLILKSRFVCAAMDRTGKPIRPTVLDPLFSAKP